MHAEAAFHDAFGGDPSEGVPPAYLKTEWLAWRLRTYGGRSPATIAHGLDPEDDRRGPYGTPDRTCPEILDSHVLGSFEAWGWPEEWAARGVCPIGGA